MWDTEPVMSFMKRPDERRREAARIARASQARPLVEPEPSRVVQADSIFNMVVVPNNQLDDISRNVMRILGPYHNVLGGPPTNGLHMSRVSNPAHTGSIAVSNGAVVGGGVGDNVAVITVPQSSSSQLPQTEPTNQQTINSVVETSSISSSSSSDVNSVVNSKKSSLLALSPNHVIINSQLTSKPAKPPLLSTAGPNNMLASTSSSSSTPLPSHHPAVISSRPPPKEYFNIPQNSHESKDVSNSLNGQTVRPQSMPFKLENSTQSVKKDEHPRYEQPFPKSQSSSKSEQQRLSSGSSAYRREGFSPTSSRSNGTPSLSGTLNRDHPGSKGEYSVQLLNNPSSPPSRLRQTNTSLSPPRLGQSNVSPPPPRLGQNSVPQPPRLGQTNNLPPPPRLMKTNTSSPPPPRLGQTTTSSPARRLQQPNTSSPPSQEQTSSALKSSTSFSTSTPSSLGVATSKQATTDFCLSTQSHSTMSSKAKPHLPNGTFQQSSKKTDRPRPNTDPGCTSEKVPLSLQIQNRIKTATSKSDLHAIIKEMADLHDPLTAIETPFSVKEEFNFSTSDPTLTKPRLDPLRGDFKEIVQKSIENKSEVRKDFIKKEDTTKKDNPPTSLPSVLPPECHTQDTNHKTELEDNAGETAEVLAAVESIMAPGDDLPTAVPELIRCGSSSSGSGNIEVKDSVRKSIDHAVYDINSILRRDLDLSEDSDAEPTVEDKTSACQSNRGKVISASPGIPVKRMLSPMSSSGSSSGSDSESSSDSSGDEDDGKKGAGEKEVSIKKVSDRRLSSSSSSTNSSSGYDLSSGEDKTEIEVKKTPEGAHLKAATERAASTISVAVTSAGPDPLTCSAQDAQTVTSMTWCLQNFIQQSKKSLTSPASISPSKPASPHGTHSAPPSVQHKDNSLTKTVDQHGATPEVNKCDKIQKASEDGNTDNVGIDKKDEVFDKKNRGEISLNKASKSSKALTSSTFQRSRETNRKQSNSVTPEYDKKPYSRESQAESASPTKIDVSKNSFSTSSSKRERKELPSSVSSLNALKSGKTLPLDTSILDSASSNINEDVDVENFTPDEKSKDRLMPGLDMSINADSRMEVTRQLFNTELVERSNESIKSTIPQGKSAPIHDIKHRKRKTGTNKHNSSFTTSVSTVANSKPSSQSSGTAQSSEVMKSSKSFSAMQSAEVVKPSKSSSTTQSSEIIKPSKSSGTTQSSEIIKPSKSSSTTQSSEIIKPSKSSGTTQSSEIIKSSKTSGTSQSSEVIKYPKKRPLDNTEMPDDATMSKLPGHLSVLPKSSKHSSPDTSSKPLPAVGSSIAQVPPHTEGYTPPHNLDGSYRHKILVQIQSGFLSRTVRNQLEKKKEKRTGIHKKMTISESSLSSKTLSGTPKEAQALSDASILSHRSNSDKDIHTLSTPQTKESSSSPSAQSVTFHTSKQKSHDSVTTGHNSTVTSPKKKSFKHAQSSKDNVSPTPSSLSESAPPSHSSKTASSHNSSITHSSPASSSQSATKKSPSAHNTTTGSKSVKNLPVSGGDRMDTALRSDKTETPKRKPDTEEEATCKKTRIEDVSENSCSMTTSTIGRRSDSMSSMGSHKSSSSSRRSNNMDNTDASNNNNSSSCKYAVKVENHITNGPVPNGLPFDHYMHVISSSDNTTTNSDVALPSAPSLPANLPPPAPVETQLHTTKHYLARAREHKRHADNLRDKLAKYEPYLRSGLSFFLAGYSMELTKREMSCSMYTDTSNLVQYVVQMKANSSSIPELTDRERKLVVLLIRLQAYLNHRLYRLKGAEVTKLRKVIESEQAKLQSSSVTNTTNLSASNTAAAASKPHAPSPHQNSWNKNSTGTPSPMSPTPSPPGSVSSQGSCEFVTGRIQNGTTSASSTPMTSPSPVLVSVQQQQVQSLSQRYFFLTGPMVKSLDLWERADAESKTFGDFFAVLDNACGPLSFHTDPLVVVRYMKHALRLLSLYQ